MQHKDYPWHTDTVVAVSRNSREHWDTRYTREQMGRLGRKWRGRIYKKGDRKTCIIPTCAWMGGWYMEEDYYWWLNNERFLKIWLYWIRLKYLTFAFKIGRNNQETRISRGYHSRSKRISSINHGFITRRRVSWRRSHWWNKRKLHSQRQWKWKWRN